MDSPVSLASRINTIHNEIETAAKGIVNHAIEAGSLLLEAKRRAGHGHWLDWLKVHCKFSERTAQRYMLIAEHRELLSRNTTHVTDLSLRGIIAFVTEPKGKGDGRKHARKKEGVAALKAGWNSSSTKSQDEFLDWADLRRKPIVIDGDGNEVHPHQIRGLISARKSE